MNEKKKWAHILPRVVLLFAVSVVLVGAISYFTQMRLSEQNIRGQMESLASKVAAESAAAITEYPAYPWLFEYWQAHSEELDIEYDVGFEDGAATQEKCRILTERYPDLQPEYATRADVEAMAEEDQTLYAEVLYTWVTAHLNQIKRAYQIDYLFCVMTEKTYDTQFFVLSASDPGAVRGREYEQVYTLGTTVSVGQSQTEAMQNARIHSSYLAAAGNYVDYYTWLCDVGENPVFIGLTYNLTTIRTQARAQAMKETVYAMTYQLVLSILCLLLTYHLILKPLGKVQKSIRRYQETKDSAAAIESLRQIGARNEIGELAQDFSNLADEIEKHIKRIEAITAEKERIGAELSLATQIQGAMLPHSFPAFPDRTDFDVYAAMDPAKEVGGDFYDFFLVDDDHLCCLIADVSGKGIPAALFMMACKIILQSVAMLGGSPAEILSKTNQAICSNNPAQMFVTVWVGMLELSTGKLTAANAGHEYPLVKKPDGQFEVLKDKHGFVLGGMDGVKYSEYTLQLEKGTKLFVYTDGAPEATDASEQMFGMERLLGAVNADPSASPEQILKNVRKAVDGFVQDAEQFDDLTMLCLEYRG